MGAPLATPRRTSRSPLLTLAAGMAYPIVGPHRPGVQSCTQGVGAPTTVGVYVSS
jgi:hypothetical protein